MWFFVLIFYLFFTFKGDTMACWHPPEYAIIQGFSYFKWGAGSLPYTLLPSCRSVRSPPAVSTLHPFSLSRSLLPLQNDQYEDQLGPWEFSTVSCPSACNALISMEVFVHFCHLSFKHDQIHCAQCVLHCEVRIPATRWQMSILRY